MLEDSRILRRTIPDCYGRIPLPSLPLPRVRRAHLPAALDGSGDFLAGKF